VNLDPRDIGSSREDGTSMQCLFYNGEFTLQVQHNFSKSCKLDTTTVKTTITTIIGSPNPTVDAVGEWQRMSLSHRALPMLWPSNAQRQGVFHLKIIINLRVKHC
jgi:hypothetical protein